MRALELKAFLCPESLWENWECTVSWPAMAWGTVCWCHVQLPGMQPPWWHRCPSLWTVANAVSQPSGHSVALGTGSPPQTGLASSTALGERVIPAPNGAIWLEGTVAPVWVIGGYRQHCGTGAWVRCVCH